MALRNSLAESALAMHVHCCSGLNGLAAVHIRVEYVQFRLMALSSLCHS